MSNDTKTDITLRLKRAEGQIRGLQRMIEQGQSCGEVITQLCAVRKALDKVGFIILSQRLRECIDDNQEKGDVRDKAVEEALELFLHMA